LFYKDDLFVGFHLQTQLGVTFDSGDNSVEAKNWSHESGKEFVTFLAETISSHSSEPTATLKLLRIASQPNDAEKQLSTIVMWSIVGGIFLLLFILFVVLYVKCKKVIELQREA